MPLPTRLQSFGPNGSHWPTPGLVLPSLQYFEAPQSIYTPFPGLGYDHEYEVDASAAAINAALVAIEADDSIPEAGAIIRVRPGDIEGFGVSSGSTPILKNRGKITWGKRVTVCPRDGYGTVRFGASRIDRVHGVAWVGFDFTGVRFVGCSRTALVWSYISGAFSGFYSDTGIAVRDCDLTEVVFGTEANTTKADRFSMYASRVGGSLTHVRMDGCYMAPNWRLDEPTVLEKNKPHVDSIQWAVSNGAPMYPRYFHIRDMAIFSSHAGCFMRSDFHFYEHVLALAGAARDQRYPPTPGSDGKGGNAIFAGWGFYNHAKDCTFIGGETFSNDNQDITAGMPDVVGSFASGTNCWQSVNNCRVSSSFTGRPPRSGSWIVDTSLDSLPQALPALPDADARRQMWNWSGAILPPPPPPPPPPPGPPVVIAPDRPASSEPVNKWSISLA